MVPKETTRRKDLTLKKAVEIAMAAEMAVLGGAQCTNQRRYIELIMQGSVNAVESEDILHQGTCYKCGEQGHMQVMCRRGKQPAAASKSEVNQLRPNYEEEDDPSICMITGGHAEGYHIHFKLDQKPIKMESYPAAIVYLSKHMQYAGW